MSDAILMLTENQFFEYCEMIDHFYVLLVMKEQGYPINLDWKVASDPFWHLLYMLFPGVQEEEGFKISFPVRLNRKAVKEIQVFCEGLFEHETWVADTEIHVTSKKIEITFDYVYHMGWICRDLILLSKELRKYMCKGDGVVYEKEVGHTSDPGRGRNAASACRKAPSRRRSARENADDGS